MKLMSIKSALLVTVALAGAAAFADQSNDPILGTDSGSTLYRVRTFVEGIPGIFQELPVSETVFLRFEGTGDAAINVNLQKEYAGVWKRKGARYELDFSDAATAELKNEAGDPHAKWSWKLKGVRLTDAGVSGKYRERLTYTTDQMRVKQVESGVFGCQPEA